MDNMTKEVAEEVAKENEEELVLTINLKCSCTDYRNALEVWKREKKNARERGIKNFIIVYMISFVLIPIDILLDFVRSEYKIIGIVLITICSIMTKDIYTYLCYVYQRKPITHIFTKIFLKHLTKFYKGRPTHEIKKIIIPFEYSFYETYFIKKSPSLEAVKVTASDKVIELPLSEEMKIEYSNIHNIKVSDNYIYICHECFIPMQQLSADVKTQINVIVEELLKP